MAKINVKVRSDIGDPGTHRIYGRLEPGATISIEEADFGAGLFERPASDWLSPHEQTDKDRAASEGQKVGDFEPPKQPAKTGKEKTATEVDANA